MWTRELMAPGLTRLRWIAFAGGALVFGGVLSLICCHRGFHSRPGAEGVGRAATEGFVLSFVAILALDFVLAMLTNGVNDLIRDPASNRPM